MEDGVDMLSGAGVWGSRYGQLPVLEADGRVAFWEFFWGIPATPAQGALALRGKESRGQESPEPGTVL